MKGLSSEHEEQLRDLMQSDSWNAVLALADLISNKQAEAVLKCDISKSSRDLLISKARLDGARQLVSALHQVKRNFKIKD